MKNQKKAFNIPAIDNHQCALAAHLGIDSMNVAASELPTRIGDSNGIHVFEHAGERYQVASARCGSKIAPCKVVSFNGSHWCIKRAA